MQSVEPLPVSPISALKGEWAKSTAFVDKGPFMGYDIAYLQRRLQIELASARRIFRPFEGLESGRREIKRH
jgi:hypothetical protein